MSNYPELVLLPWRPRLPLLQPGQVPQQTPVL